MITFVKKADMYKLGDRVKFLNDVGGGVVTKIMSKSLVHVENEDGFEIPVAVSGIILDNSDVIRGQKPTVEQFVKQVKVEVRPDVIPADEPPVIIKGNDEPQFYLAFVPENSNNPLEGQTQIYLINDCNFYVLFHYSHYKDAAYKTVDAGKLEPNTKLLLGSISQVDISSLPEFSFQLLYYKDQSTRIETAVTRRIGVNPVKFYKGGSFSKSGFFREKAMLFKLNETEMDKALEQLTEKEVKKVIKVKEPPRQNQIRLKAETPELIEVDLHMHELVDNTAGLSNKEMLDFQMKKFNEQMEAAIANQAVKKIVFIHGLGNGVLKQELRRKLGTKYKKYSFQDASFQEYGYGATMVILRK